MAGDLPPVVAAHDLGEHRPLQLLGRGPGLAVQLGVVDGGRGPAGEVLGEADVVLVVEPRVVGGDPREHTDDPAADPQGDEQGTAQAQLARDAQLLGVAGPGHEHLVGDLVDELGLPGSRHGAGAGGAGRVGGPALLQGPGQLDLLRVDVGDRQPVHPSVADDVDGAPVGEGGHGQSGHPVDGHLEVEAARELDGGLREEGQAGGLAAGDDGGVDALEGLGTRVGHDVEEVEHDRVGLERAGERQGDRPDGAPGDPQRQGDDGALPAVGSREVGVGREHGRGVEHEPSPGADRVGRGGASLHGDQLPALRLAHREPAQPDDPGPLALAQGERRDARAHGIRHVVGHDLGDGVDGVGRRQLAGHPGQAREAVPHAGRRAGVLVTVGLVLHPGILAVHGACCQWPDRAVPHTGVTAGAHGTTGAATCRVGGMPRERPRETLSKVRARMATRCLGSWHHTRDQADHSPRGEGRGG